MTYTDLALAEEEGKLEAALLESRNLLIEAPTGSGKSLFIPYFLSKHCKGRVVVLQPRRIENLVINQKFREGKPPYMDAATGEKLKYPR